MTYHTVMTIGVACALSTSAAVADPVVMTDAQMDNVTAGLTVNGNEVIYFECDAACVARGFTEPLMVVIAGTNSVEDGPVLPSAVHDNNNGLRGFGPWEAAFGSAGTPADVANGGPIDHAPLVVAE